MSTQNPANDAIIHENTQVFQDFLKTHFSSAMPTDINWDNDFGQSWSDSPSDPFWNDPGDNGPDSD